MIRCPASSSPAPSSTRSVRTRHADYVRGRSGRQNGERDLLKGRTIGGRTYKVHLDGYDSGRPSRAKPPGRARVHLLDRRRSVAALRYNDIKITFLKQEAEGLRSAAALRAAARSDDHQPSHGPVRARRGGERDGLPALVHGAHVRHRARRRLCRPVAAELKEFPPRQKPGSFTSTASWRPSRAARRSRQTDGCRSVRLRAAPARVRPFRPGSRSIPRPREKAGKPQRSFPARETCFRAVTWPAPPRGNFAKSFCIASLRFCWRFSGDALC